MRFAYLLAYLSIAGLVHGLAIDHSKAAPKRGSKDNKGTKGAKDNKATTNHKDYCVIEASTPLVLVGKDYPTQRHCESRVPAPVFINSITTWNNGDTITGMKFGYTDNANTFRRYGQDFSGEETSITLEPGELITSATLYENGASHKGKGVRLGRISLTTTNKRTVNLGKSKANPPYDIPVGTGLIIGATIRHGTEIDQFGFHFLDGEIKNITMSDFHFKEDPTNTTSGLKLESRSKVHYYNNGTGDNGWHFAESKDEEVWSEYSSQTVKTWGASISASASVGFAFVGASVTATSSWQYQITEIKKSGLRGKKTLQWAQNGILKPKTGVSCEATVWTGEGEWPYTVKATLLLESGKKFWYTETGRLKVGAWSDVKATCQDNNNPIPPAGYERGSLGGDKSKAVSRPPAVAPAKPAPPPAAAKAALPPPAAAKAAPPPPAAAKAAPPPPAAAKPAPPPAPAKPAPAPAPAKPAPPPAPGKPAPPPAAAKPAPPPAAAKPAPAPGKPAAPPAPAPAPVPAKPANTPLAPKPAAAADPAKPATGKPIAKKVNN